MKSIRSLATKPLQKLIEQDLPLRQAYQLAMLATRLNPTLEFYGNQLMSGRPQAELNELDADTLDGEEDPGRFSLVVQNGQASLRNLKPSGSVFYLR